MPLVIPPGFAHVAMEHRAAGDPTPWYVTFGIDVSTFGGDTAAMALNASDSYINAFGSRISNIVNISGTQLTVGQDGDPIRVFHQRIGGGQGASTQAKLPQNCALLIRKNSGTGGRRHRGRMFLPGILDEEGVDNIGIINSANVAAYNTAAAEFFVGLSDGEGLNEPTPMVLLHSSGLSAVPPPTVITGLQVDGVISTQRRRLR